MSYNPNLPAGQAVSASSAPVVLASDQSAVPTTNAGDKTASGTISALNANLLTGVATANSTVVLTGPLVGLSNLSVHVVGAFTGTLVVQVSNDNTNWVAITGNVYYSAGSSLLTSINGPGIYIVDIGSFAYCRITCSAYTSGAPVVSLKISNSSSLVVLGATTSTIGVVALYVSTSSSAPTQSKVLTAATTNATSLKTTLAKLFAVILSNNATTARYIHFYNKASAPTVGTDSPAFTLTLSANTIAQPFQFSSDVGIAFATGLAYSITAAAGDLDATVTVANDVTGVITWI